MEGLAILGALVDVVYRMVNWPLSGDMEEREIKINLGCGLSGIEGWHNLDNSITIPVSRFPLLNRILNVPRWPKDVRRWDARRGLPFPSGSVTYIYSSHTFEHFSYSQSLKIAKECFRALKTGGIIRIAVPDLELLVRNYIADKDPMASHAFVSGLSLGHSIHDLVHPGSNHSQMFDRRSLTHLLREAGFSNPAPKGFRDSAIPEIDRLDLEVRRAESLYIEAQKE